MKMHSHAMNVLRKIKTQVVEHAAMATEACLEVAGVKRPSALFVLGHMRSGSSLLLHLLLTDPEIAALGERNARYSSAADIARLALLVRLARRAPMLRVRYVADQINHSAYTPNARLLQDARVRVLFILRQPSASISSLLELLRQHYQSAWTASAAVEYYADRLRVLMEMGERLFDCANAALIHYESLVEKPEQTLEALRLFLGLRHRLSQNYRIYPFTQTRGDPGPNIIAGRIVRARDCPQVKVSEAQLERATRAYIECSGTLARLALIPRQTLEVTNSLAANCS